MKKTTLIAVAVFFTMAAYSQGVQFGFKAGINRTNVKDDLALNQTNTETGFHVGGLAHIHVNRRFAIQPELTFSSEPVKYTVPTYNGETKNYFINLPVLAQYMFANGLRLQTGPQVGYLASSKFEPADGGAERDLKKDVVRDVIFEWSFGAGYMTRSGFGVDARYNTGLSNMYQQGAALAKTRVWQFGLFYQLPR